MMLYIKAFHIIAMVCWLAGIFYLPRLFVYHAETLDTVSIARFKIMERRLYYGITCPSAVITTALGFWLLSYNFSYYMQAGWMQVKFALVLGLWVYHFICGFYLRQFNYDRNTRSARFYRVFNEIPIVILIGIVIMVVVKPL